MRLRNWERLLFETYSDYYEAPNKKYKHHIEEFGENGKSISWIGLPDKNKNLQLYLWNYDDGIYFMPLPQLFDLYEDDLIELLRIPYERVYNGFLLTEEQTFTFHETLVKLQEILKEREASERRQSDLTSSLIEAHVELGKEKERADAYQNQCEEHVSYINDLEAQIEDMERVHNDLIGERDGYKNRVKELEPIVCVCHKDTACRRCRYLSHNIEDENEHLKSKLKAYEEQMNSLLDTIETEKASNYNMWARQQAFFEENERLKKQLGVELARRDSYEEDIKRLKRETGELKKKCTSFQEMKDREDNLFEKYGTFIRNSIYNALVETIEDGRQLRDEYINLFIDNAFKRCEELFRGGYIDLIQYGGLRVKLKEMRK